MTLIKLVLMCSLSNCTVLNDPDCTIFCSNVLITVTLPYVVGIADPDKMQLESISTEQFHQLMENLNYMVFSHKNSTDQ